MARSRRFPREFATIVLVVAVFALMAARSAAFLHAANLMVVGETAAFVGIMACGEGAVILSGGLDLSVGAVLALSSCATAAALASGLSGLVAAAIGLAAGAICGAINGALITYRRIPPILATLGTLLLFRYGASIATRARDFGPFSDAFNRIGSGWAPAVLFVLVVCLFMIFTLRSGAGRWLIAVGGNERAAALSGVPVARAQRLVYTLSATCAGLAGLITMAFKNNTQSSVGMGYELDVIAACVVGGVRITGGDGSILGAALGAVLIALLRDALILTGRPAEQYGLFTGAVILVAAVFERWRAARSGVQR